MIPGTSIKGMKALKGLAPLQASSAMIADTATTSTMQYLDRTIHANTTGGTIKQRIGRRKHQHYRKSRYAVMQKLAQSEEAARVPHDRAQKSDNTTTTVVRMLMHDNYIAGAAYIFAQFDDVSDAQQAVKMLHGRWFGGRQLRPTFTTRMRLFEQLSITM
ncbi:hypothetical protein BDF22DRAFT_778535 [Syncephalis plumigaleata]|nr:hypothetical protein BDF22DRAFT_778535 [Syncephalis plumigaleata]